MFILPNRSIFTNYAVRSEWPRDLVSDSKLSSHEALLACSRGLASKSDFVSKFEKLQSLPLGLHGAVIRGHDVPARFGLPGIAPHIFREQCGRRREVRSPDDDLLLLLGQVSGEACDAFREPVPLTRARFADNFGR